MDVTRHNQEAAYQDLCALLPQCEFYALDLEMTGIRAPEKLLRRRQQAVAAAKQCTTDDLSVATNPANQAALAANPLVTHSQLTAPCESYDEKIVAASTFNVVQLGLSLFFKKGTVVETAVGSDPLGNYATTVAATATSPAVGEPSAESPSPSADTNNTKTPKRSDKRHSNNRQVGAVTLPLTPAGRKLWQKVDEVMARNVPPTADAGADGSAAATTTPIPVTLVDTNVNDASALVTNAIVALCGAIDQLSSSADPMKSGDEFTDSGMAPMDTMEEVKGKLAILFEHTNAFNALTDCVQIKGLVEDYARRALLSADGTKRLVGSPASAAADPNATTSCRWKSFNELFTTKALDMGRMVPVPQKNGAAGSAASSSSNGSNAFGAKRGGNNSNNNNNNNNNTAAEQISIASPTTGSSTSASATTTTANDEYTIRAFSFYLFPNPNLDARDMTMNSTTVGDFLAKQSPISFDKWIRMGVHYVSREKLMRIRNDKALKFAAEKLTTASNSKNNTKSSAGTVFSELKEKCPSLSHEEIGDLEKFLTKCRQFSAESVKYKEEVAAAGGEANAPPSLKAKAPRPLPMPFMKPDAFSVIRKLFVELGMEKVGKNAVMSERFAPKGAASPSSPSKKETTSGSPTTASESGAGGVSDRISNALFNKWQEVTESAGSCGTRVFELLIGSKKPVIVQNGWSDLAFLYTAFHGCTPIDLPAFKTAMTALFPTVYDSRTLATLEQFNSFSNRGRLERMYQSFQQEHGSKVNVYVPEVGQELFAPDESSGAAAAHDASYDSFITGCLFLYERLALPTIADVAKFANIVPCYGSVFSLKLDDTASDVYLTCDANAPVLRITFANEADYAKGPRALYSGQTRIKSTLTRQSLPGVVQVPNDREVLYFVESTAKGLGTLFDFSVSQSLPYIEKDIGFKVKVETMPMREAMALVGMTVKPFWPEGLAWPQK